MHQHLLGQFQSGGLEHYRPVNGVKLQDVFANYMDIRWPKGCLLAARTRNAEIVGEGIEPNVSDVVLIEGQGNAPFKALLRATDAKVFQRLVL